jgi:hypothetical protein
MFGTGCHVPGNCCAHCTTACLPCALRSVHGGPHRKLRKLTLDCETERKSPVGATQSAPC